MSGIRGTLREDAQQHWWVEHCYPLTDTPRLVKTRWKITTGRRTGPFAPILSDGLVVSSCDGDAWQAYSQGDYLVLQTEHNGTALPETDIPCPPVRRGTETRYRYGRWEKYLKSEGWVTA